MATIDNTFTTHRTGATTGITQQGDVATAKRATQKAGTGAAAGVAATPPPPSSVGAATGFDAEYYLGTAPDVAEFTAADEKRLNDVAALVANLLDETAATKTASSNTYITRTRTQDLMTLLSQIMNLERGMAIQKITNHALNNISELKQAADDMRKSASKMLMGAIANVVLTSAGSVASMVGAKKALNETSAATDKLKPATNLQANHNEQVEKLQSASATKFNERTPELHSQIEADKLSLRSTQGKIKGIHSAADIHTKTAESYNMMGRAFGDLSNAAGRFTEAYFQVESKRMEADMAEKQANAQLEQGTKEMALQNLNAIKTMVEALINAFKEIRDTQDQVKANIARNA